MKREVFTSTMSTGITWRSFSKIDRMHGADDDGETQHTLLYHDMME